MLEFQPSDPDPLPDNVYPFPSINHNENNHHATPERTDNPRPVDQIVSTVKDLVKLKEGEKDRFVHSRSRIITSAEGAVVHLSEYDLFDKSNPYATASRKAEPDPRVVGIAIHSHAPTEESLSEAVYFSEFYVVVKDDANNYVLIAETHDSETDSWNVDKVDEAGAAELLKRLQKL